MGAGSNLHDVIPGDVLGNTKPLIWSNTIRIYNDGGNDLQFSFTADDDGDNEVHGVIKAGKEALYRVRHEAGIALRFPGGGGGSVFRVEAW
jgi:hypothetical protein